MASRRIYPQDFVEPCIPTLTARPTSGADWVHEIKYRLIVRRVGETVRCSPVEALMERALYRNRYAPTKNCADCAHGITPYYPDRTRGNRGRLAICCFGHCCLPGAYRPLLEKF
jgi:hypothetical protein